MTGITGSPSIRATFKLFKILSTVVTSKLYIHCVKQNFHIFFGFPLTLLSLFHSKFFGCGMFFSSEYAKFEKNLQAFVLLFELKETT